MVPQHQVNAGTATHDTQCAAAPEIDQFMHVITHELGYPLSKAVEAAKFELTVHEVSRLMFQEPPVALSESVAQQTFETWLQPRSRLLKRVLIASWRGVRWPRQP